MLDQLCWSSKLTGISMITKYVYRNKKTGAVICTNEQLDPNKYELIREVRDGQMKLREVMTKNYAR